MSQKTRQEVVAKLRRSYAKAGARYKRQLLVQAVALLGYHRKAAIRVLRARAAPLSPGGPPLLLGRPREYDPRNPLPGLQPILFAALAASGPRLGR